MPDSYPKPWSVIEQDECLIVVDSTGFKIAYLYFEARMPEHQIGGERMSKAHARAIAGKMLRAGQPSRRCCLAFDHPPSP